LRINLYKEKNFSNSIFKSKYKKSILRMQHNVLILDFGSQYTQLIARRVRELIYSAKFSITIIFRVIYPLQSSNIRGSPFSVRSEDAPHPDLSQIRGKLPLLAVCYGAIFSSF
jgi:GMP synthase (glutamine-hydrolysing)